jgi:hypothetical protein
MRSSKEVDEVRCFGRSARLVSCVGSSLEQVGGGLREEPLELVDPGELLGVKCLCKRGRLPACRAPACAAAAA